MVQLIWLHIDPRRQDKMSIKYAWGKKKSEFDTNFKVLVPKYYSALLVPCQVRVLHKHDAALGYAKTDELAWSCSNKIYAL